MTKASLVLVTAPSAEVAAHLARGLVEARLAACVNVIPAVQSFYVWEGKLEEETEVQLVIKTTRERVDALTAWVEEHHPYDVPEVLALPIEGGSKAYLAWLRGEIEASPI